MKLRVPGKYSGHYGMVLFAGGVSVGTVSPKQANLMRAVMQGVEILEDDGVTLDVALNALSVIYPLDFYFERGIEPPSKYVTRWDGSYPEAPVEVSTEVSTAPVEPVTVDAGNLWTRAELEVLADKKGIKGLREVAPDGITGRAVSELIESILAAGAAKS